MADDDLDLELDDEDLFVQDGPGLFGDDDSQPAPRPDPVDEDEEPDDEVPDDDAPGETTGPESAPQPPRDLLPPPAPDRGPRQVLQDAPLALYRRYRPETFAEVIGQDHVTEPLQRALVNNRVNHAYLFSGPRGCGKTTSARILARALNCDQGPTPTPCGVCQSCRDLARGGSGSIDVIEIDAASHGGVDDARDLRERAFFAPVHSRYKIYIVDEAHMVTPAGFNAMLKLVEEPPPHVKFIFATTEPDKVIGTIRSRTHHYPFRLVPPKLLTGYLSTLCEAEGVEVDPQVLPLVVRAGGGSVRDSLSVLDQLLGGAGEDGVSYHQAAGLLGYTPDTLLDEVMDAFAAGDARSVFAAVDKVIEVGQDPRRFAEDLLRRLRDLVIVAAVPDAVSSGLIDVSDDQAERLGVQAQGMGPGELTRAAEVIATGLTEMRGTTAPRLHLELMCARVLLPGADVDDRGVHARLDRLERRITASGVSPGVAEPAAGSPDRSTDREWTTEQPAPPATSQQGGAGTSDGGRPPEATPGARPRQRPAPSPAQSAAVGSPRDRSPGGATAAATTAQPDPSGGQAPPVQSRTTSSAPTPASSPAADPLALDVIRVRHAWPQVLETVKGRRRFTWMILSQHAQVVDVQAGTLTLGFANPGARDNFTSGGSNDILRDCLVEVLGADLAIVPIVDGGERAPAEPAGQRPAPPATRPPAPTGPRSSGAHASSDQSPHRRSSAGGASEPGGPGEPVRDGAVPGGAPDSAESPDSPRSPSTVQDGEPASWSAVTDRRPDHSRHTAAARDRIRPMSTQPVASPSDPPEDELADDDDVVLDDGLTSAADLVVKHLGAQLLHEEQR